MSGRPPYFDHAQRHTPFGSDAIRFAEYEFKLAGDSNTIAAGDGTLYWRIPRSVAGLSLVDAQAYVSTPSSSGDVQVMIHNLTNAADMLASVITIDESEIDSYTSSSPSDVDDSEALVALGDQIRFDVDAAGTEAKGLGVTLTFG